MTIIDNKTVVVTTTKMSEGVGGGRSNLARGSTAEYFINDSRQCTAHATSSFYSLFIIGPKQKAMSSVKLAFWGILEVWTMATKKANLSGWPSIRQSLSSFSSLFSSSFFFFFFVFFFSFCYLWIVFIALFSFFLSFCTVVTTQGSKARWRW